jgi:drug/metabolite transporter (DMT)-like permease
MPLDAFLLALAAAFTHAFWNILLARARDPQAATAVALLVSIVVFAPVAALTWELEAAAWPYLAVTSVLQLVYFGLLIYAYRRAELSVVYPVSRGLAPVLVLAAGVVVLGAATSAVQVGGVLLVGLGVLLVRGLRAEADPVGLAFGVLIACVIASYTLLDSRGIRYANPITYLEVSMIPCALAYAAAIAHIQGRASLRGELNLSAVTAGVATFTAYALVLAALDRASAASVAAVRETSILIATGLAAFVLHERVSPGRLAGAVLIVGGVALVALA